MTIQENVVINVTDGGSLDKVNAKAKVTHKTLAAAADAATRVATPQRFAAAAASSRQQLQDSRDSGTARGIGGMTGAAGRDFGAQAQGLGGLVHVYATFAANLFAVSAAFAALSKAADTTNMIKGLDQLGAASGRGLGSLAKQLSAVTDGAISLREAMTATAQASAGGMSGENILRMGKIAKQASQALGVAMPDAVSRLSRGITKLEPELLDEIGIMVRVDRAAEAYARTLGKTTSALTDFEKRQGFANAVLEQGEAKFGVINIDANPYAKILASTQNLLQSGLELINKVMGPLMGFLAASPTGLSIALASVAGVLLKQAIPALGMYRETAKRMANEAHERVKQQVADQTSALIQSDAAAAQAAERAFSLEQKNVKKINDLKNTRFNKDIIGKDLRNVLGTTSALDLSKDEMAGIKARAATLEASDNEIHRKQGERLKRHYDNLERIRAAAREAGHRAAVAQGADDDASWYTHQAQQAKKLEKLNRASQRRASLSTIADTSATLGPVEALKVLKKEVGNTTGSLSKASLAVRGFATVATSAVGTAISAFAVWGQAAALAGVAFTLLDKWVSSSAAQEIAYAGSLQALDDSFANINRTLEDLSKKPLLQQFGVEAINARASALQELNNSLKKTVDTFGSLISAQNGWDKFFDGFWDLFGKGSGDKAALGISTSVVTALEAMEDGPAKEAAATALKKLLGQDIDLKNISAFNTQIKDLGNSKIFDIGKKTSSIISLATSEVSKSAGAVVEAKNALSALNKQVDAYNVGIKLKDDFSTLGNIVSAAGDKMGLALADPINGLATLVELSRDMKTLSLLPPETAQELALSAAALENLAESLQAAKNEAKEAGNSLNKARIREAAAGDGSSGSEASVIAAQAETAAAEIRERSAKKVLQDLSTQQAAALSKWAKAGFELFQSGIALAEKGLSRALTEASISASKGVLDLIKSVGGDTTLADAELRLKAINLQEVELQAKYDNTLAITKLTLATEAQTLSTDLAREERRRDKAQGAEVDEVESLISTIKKSIDNNKLAQATLAGGPSAVLALNRRAGAPGGDVSSTEYGASKQLGTVTEAARGLAAGKAKLGADKANSELQKQADLIRKIANDENRSLDLKIRSIKIEREHNSSLIEASAIYSEDLQNQKDQLTIAEQKAAFNKKIATSNRDIDLASLALKNAKGDSARNSAQETLDNIKKERVSFIQENVSATLKQELTSLKERTAGETALFDLKVSREIKLRDIKSSITEAENDSIKSQLDYRKSLGFIGEGELSRAEQNLALSAQQLTYDREFTALAIEKQKALNAAEAKVKESRLISEANPDDSAAASTLASNEAEVARINDLYGYQQQALTLINESKVRGINLSREQADKLVEQADKTQLIADLTNSLTVAFGDLGASIGSVVSILDTMAQNDIKYLEQKKSLQEELEKHEDTSPERTKVASDLIKLEKKKVQSELSGIANIANASKKMFKEKTVAHKLLAGVEKAIHAAKIVMMIQEAITAVTTAGTVAAADGAKAASGGVTAIINAMKSLPFPASLAAGAVMAAVVASLLGGGSKASIPAGFTAEERQETQGTGQAWVGGKKVETGGGVFGDVEAKSESIKNSLEIIRDNTLDGLNYDRGMLRALESIERGIGKASLSLYGTTGIRSGSFTGRDDVSIKSSGIQGLFGKKTTAEIIDSGIEIKGTFGQLAESAAGLVQQYETIRTTVKSSGFLGIGGKTKTSTSTSYQSAGPEIEEEINNIFSHARDLFTEVGDKIGLTASDITKTLGGIDLSGAFASLRGLQGEALEAEFSAVIGSILDNAAGEIFSQMSKYRQFGEGLLQTVIRVVDGSEKVKVAFDSVSISITNFTFDVTEAIIEAAGGLEEFTSNIRFFSDNFLTEAERLAPVSRNVTDTLSRLGFSMVDTREEFALLVQSLDLTTIYGRETFQELMDLSQAFSMVYPETRKMVSAQELWNQRLSQTIAILKLEGRTGEALVLQRLNELSAMDESLRAGQLYLYALEDENSIKAKLKSAYEKENSVIKSTISNLGKFIETLKAFKDSLVLSNVSILTPAQKYEEARSQAQTVAAIATGIATTEAEITARNDAINQLPSVSNAFLEASRTMFASGAQYTADFNYILGIVGSTSESLSSQLTESEQQLLVLEENQVILDIIKENTQTTSELLAQFNSAQSITALAQQGYAMNLNTMTAELLSKASLSADMMRIMMASVGLIAPAMLSMVDAAANAPTMSIPTNVSDDRVAILSEVQAATNQELTAQITELNNQLTALRTEQQQQTADLMATNYDATMTAARTAWELELNSRYSEPIEWSYR